MKKKATIKPATIRPAPIQYRQLTNREHDILQAWETVPKELWSSPDLFAKTEPNNWIVRGKAYDLIMTDGIEALGFSIQRCFDFCLEIIDQLDAAENNHLDSVGPLLALLQERNKIFHYVYEKAVDGEQDEYGRPTCDTNKVMVIVKEYDRHHYGQAIRRTNWIRKWEARFGNHSYCSHDNQLIGYRDKVETIKRQSFVLSNDDYDDVKIYPEVTQYIKTRNELTMIQWKFWAMARACVKLFGINETTEKSMTFMPCRIQLDDKSFYLQVSKEICDMMLSPELESSWSLDDEIK